MGSGLRALVRVRAWGLLILLVTPLVALGPAMVVDRGWDGAPRISALPAALVVLDPLVWRCVRNSLAIALVVTLGALTLGTGLGLILGRRRFWGRSVLGGLAVIPLAVGPIWVAPGVVAWLGGGAGWSWLAARTFWGQPGDEWARWVALIWVELAASTPLAILGVRRALARIDPTWADAARVVGASRRRVWLDVSWPTIRPELARVGGRIFALVLIEPAGPMILDLRRTLVVETADAALRFDEPNRAATLALIAIAASLLVRAAIGRWGGSDATAPGGPTSGPVDRQAGRWGGFVLTLILLGWIGFALGPVASFGARLCQAALGDRGLSGATARSILIAGANPTTRAWALNSASTATLAVGLDLLILFSLAASGPGARRRWAGSFAVIPPLALSVGALAIPSLLSAWSAARGQAALVPVLERLRAELSPGRSPGFLVILVLAATHLPTLASGDPSSRRAASPAPLDAALLTGSSARQARRLVRGPTGPGWWGLIIATWTWAGTDLAAVWLLTGLAERRTLAPAALGQVGRGVDPLDPGLLGLFVLIVGLRLIGLALVNRIAAPSRRGDEWPAI